MQLLKFQWNLIRVEFTVYCQKKDNVKIILNINFINFISSSFLHELLMKCQSAQNSGIAPEWFSTRKAAVNSQLSLSAILT